MHRARQGCFELLLSSAALSFSNKVIPQLLCFFFITKFEKQTEHMSQLFSMLINFYSLIEGIPQLDKTLSRTGQTWTRHWPNWTNLKGLLSGRGFVGNKRFFTCGT